MSVEVKVSYPKKTHKAKRYILRHFKFPIVISYNDPMENLPKALELLLVDMKENGIDRWNVEEITEEWNLGEPISEPVDLEPKKEFDI
jgi:hypothetical protein